MLYHVAPALLHPYIYVNGANIVLLFVFGITSFQNVVTQL
jgi:hypothetical protein